MKLMATRRIYSAISCALVAALLAGCGGGGSGSTPPIHKGATGGNGNVTMTFAVPVRSTSSIVKGKRKKNYVSYSTAGFEVSWEVNNFGPTDLSGTSYSDGFNHTEACIGNPTGAGCASVPNFVGKVAPNLVSQNITCGAQANPGASYSCTIVFPVPAGYDDFQFSLWDQKPFSYGTGGIGFGGSFNSTANMLSYSLVADQQVLGASNNAFSLTLHPVIHSMYLGLDPSSLVVGAQSPGTSINPTAPSLEFFALDADGNTIHGTASETYVDLNGDPAYVQVSPNQTNPGSPVGAVAVLDLNQPLSLTPNSCLALPANGGLSNPMQNACTVTYDGGDVLSVAYPGTVYKFCPDASNPGGTCTNDSSNVSVTQTSLNFTRSINGPILVPSEPALVSIPAGIATNFGVVGRDQNAYLTANNGRIYQVNLVGPVVQSFGNGGTFGGGANAPGAADSLQGVTQGPDNQIWFADPTAHKTGALNLQNGLFMPPVSSTGTPVQIVSGPDNNMYLAEQDRPGEVAITPGTQTTPPTYQIFEGSPIVGGNLQTIVVGSDGHLWYSDKGNNLIASFSAGNVAGAQTNCAVAMTAPVGMTTGADGYLYVAESGANKRVDKIATAGGACFLIQSFSTTTAAPEQLTTGADGNVYGVESDGVTALRISQAPPGAPGGVGGQLTEFPYVSTAPGFSAIFAGADGKIWTSSTTNNVWYFQP